MASFLLSEVYIVEKMLSSGHPDLDDLTCEATVCTSLQQAYCEAIKNMISAALDQNCASEEEESLRYELAKAMRRRGVSPEKRYLTLKEIIISASRAFHAEKTYYTVKRSSIIPHREIHEETMITDALKLLGETEEKAEDAPGSSARNARQPPRDPSLRGRGRVLPPCLPTRKAFRERELMVTNIDITHCKAIKSFSVNSQQPRPWSVYELLIRSISSFPVLCNIECSITLEKPLPLAG